VFVLLRSREKDNTGQWKSFVVAMCRKYIAIWPIYVSNSKKTTKYLPEEQAKKKETSKFLF